VNFDPYGWYSPEQRAVRLTQRLELAARRRAGVELPDPVCRAVRLVVHAALYGYKSLLDLDRRAAAAVEGFMRW
jgi:hypothetical protein